MPIRFVEGSEPAAIFDGRCVAEDADLFVEWLRRTYDPAIDLGSCSDLHTALVQLLLGSKVRVTALPADTILAGLIANNHSKVIS